MLFSLFFVLIFLNKNLVIVIAAGERGGCEKKVILSSKLKNYAPVFLFFSVIFSYFPPIFSGEKILFSYFSGRPMCWAPCKWLTVGSAGACFMVVLIPVKRVILTHRGRDKMDAISQTTFSSAFSSMKMVVFWLNFHWNMFTRVQLIIIQHWFR